jgi:hypothetical protein
MCKIYGKIIGVVNGLNMKTKGRFIGTLEQYHRRVYKYSKDSTHTGAGIAQPVWRLATGWTTRRGGSSSPGRVKNSHFSILSRPALGSTQPPIKWVPGSLSRG